VLLLNWPFLTIPFSYGIVAGLLWLFGVWALVVLALFLAARRIGSTPPGGERREG
jgi:hypothetical protein